MRLVDAAGHHLRVDMDATRRRGLRRRPPAAARGAALAARAAMPGRASARRVRCDVAALASQSSQKFERGVSEFSLKRLGDLRA